MKKGAILAVILMFSAILLSACNYEDEANYAWVEISQGFIRQDLNKGLHKDNCFYVEFLFDCEIEAQFSANGDSGFMAYTGSVDGLTPVGEEIFCANVGQGEKLYINNCPKQALLAIEQNFLSIIFFENKMPVGYTLIYVAALEIEGNKVTREMVGDATLNNEQTYVFYIGNVIHSAKFKGESDITVNQIKERIYLMEINYLLGLR